MGLAPKPIKEIELLLMQLCTNVSQAHAELPEILLQKSPSTDIVVPESCVIVSKCLVASHLTLQKPNGFTRKW